MSNKKTEDVEDVVESPIPGDATNVVDVIFNIDNGDFNGAGVSTFVIDRPHAYLVGATFMRIRDALAADGVLYIRKGLEGGVKNVLGVYLEREGVDGEFVKYGRKN